MCSSTRYDSSTLKANVWLADKTRDLRRGRHGDDMAKEQTGLAELEEEIRQIDGVISAVVFNDGAGNPVEIQAFTKTGTPETGVRAAIRDTLSRRGKISTAERVFVFELTGLPVGSSTRIGAPNVEGASASWSGRISLEETPPRRESTPDRTGRRPRIGRISLASRENVAEATISLIFGEREAQGLGRAHKTPYSLRLTAAATLEAAQALLGEKGMFRLQGVSLVEVLKQGVVLVIVDSTADGEENRLLGASLVKDAPPYEATVKATLDAVNRQLEAILSAQP